MRGEHPYVLCCCCCSRVVMIFPHSHTCDESTFPPYEYIVKARVVVVVVVNTKYVTRGCRHTKIGQNFALLEPTWVRNRAAIVSLLPENDAESRASDRSNRFVLWKKWVKSATFRSSNRMMIRSLMAATAAGHHGLDLSAPSSRSFVARRTMVFKPKVVNTNPRKKKSWKLFVFYPPSGSYSNSV